MFAVYMAVYYVFLFLVMGVLGFAGLWLVDLVFKTDFAVRYKAFLLGVDEWRRKTFTKPQVERDNSPEKPPPIEEWQRA